MSDDISIPSPGYYHHRRQADGGDSGTVRLAVIAGGILAGLGLVLGGLTLLGHHRGPVPVIQADERPLRIKPENPGGLQVAGANSDIMSGGNDTRASKLAPPPETPDPQALRAQAPPAPVPAPPVAAAVPPPAPAPAVVAPAVVAPAAIVPAVSPPVVAPTVQAPPAPKPAAAVAPTKPEVHPAPHPKAIIQLAALESESAARAEWQALQKRIPEVLSGHQPSFSKTERAGKTYWRLRTSGFADVAQAKAACDKVRAKGSACSVAEF